MASQTAGGPGDGSGFGYQSGFGNPAGSYLLNECGSAGFDPSLAQTVSGLNIGDTYQVQIDIRLFDAQPAANSFGMFLDSEPGNPFLETQAPDFDGWYTETGTFVATSTSHTIIFASELNGTDVSDYIDNASLTDEGSGPVPEPATLILVGTALFGLARRIKGSR